MEPSVLGLHRNVMETQNVVTSDFMPVSPVTGKTLYQSGSAIARVFMALLAGIRAGELVRLLTSGVAHYAFTRHADFRGRAGLRWDLLINDVLQTVPLTVASFNALSANAVIRIVNVRPSDLFVNARYPRSRPGDSAAIIAQRAAIDSDVPTGPLMLSAPSVDPTIIDAEFTVVEPPAVAVEPPAVAVEPPAVVTPNRRERRKSKQK